MFEKEAYEYREKGKRDGYYLVTQEMEQEALDYIIDETFKDAAEFGFQKGIKARINTTTISDCPIKDEWHYMKDELPPENIPLNILTLDKDKKKRLWTGEYKGGNGEWWTGYFNHFIDKPYAWKEIVPPKEEL